MFQAGAEALSSFFELQLVTPPGGLAAPSALNPPPFFVGLVRPEAVVVGRAGGSNVAFDLSLTFLTPLPLPLPYPPPVPVPYPPALDPVSCGLITPLPFAPIVRGNLDG